MSKKQILAILAMFFLIAALGFGLNISPEDQASITSVVTELADSFNME